MCFLAVFWFLDLSGSAMVTYAPPPIKTGAGMAGAQAPATAWSARQSEHHERRAID
jgi:hypothetical protein